MDSVHQEALSPGVQRFSRVFGYGKYLVEHFFGYAFLGAIIWGQWHQTHIKSTALLSLYYAEQLENGVTSLETNQRGYLYTGDPDLYRNYITSKAVCITAAHHLEATLGTDAEDLSRLHHAQDLIERKIKEMDQTITYFRIGNPDDAKRLVQTHEGQRYMSEIRQVLAEIRNAKEVQAIAAMSIIWFYMPGPPFDTIPSPFQQ